MKDFLKNNKSLILVGFIIIGILWLTQSYYKKTVELNKELTTIKESLVTTKESYKNEVSRLETEYQKKISEISSKNKKTKISIVKNADGSSRKDIEISDLAYNEKNVDENVKTAENKQLVEANKESEVSSKELVHSKEEFKSEEIKKSNWGGIGLVAGGAIIVLCFSTGHCSFSF